MINHVRTLLLNKTAAIAGLATLDPGAEAIAAEFAPVVLPPALAAFRRALLPDGQTAYQYNFRLAGLMQIVHAPELEDYALLLDRRYTYALGDDYMSQLRAAAVDVSTWYSDTSDVSLVYNYFHTRRWTQPGAHFKWVIRHEADTGNTVNITLNGGATQTLHVTFNGTRSSTITLVPDYLSIYFATPNGALSGTFRMEVEFQLAPVVDLVATLTTIAALDNRIALSGLLFADWAPYSATLTELRELWRHSREAPVRLGASILGYALKCEQLRRGGTLSVSTLRSSG